MKLRDIPTRIVVRPPDGWGDVVTEVYYDYGDRKPTYSYQRGNR